MESGMMTRNEVVAACLRFPGAYEDYPFDPPTSAAMRHRANRKIFALIFERGGKVWVNVKAEPLRADFWRDVYPAVVPGFHMNKRHWISVCFNRGLADERICELVRDSYELVVASLPKRMREALR